MSINIEELKIVLTTNIEDTELKTVVFKKGMLYNPELSNSSILLNEYPYFTSDIKYPFSILQYLSYKDRVEFFFNKEKFRERLIIYSINDNILDITEILDEEKEKKYYEERNKNIERNIMITLELLFPTKYPVINDLQTSYDMILNKSNIRYMVLNPIITKYFSYLKLGEEVYTFKKIIWINDILNHPKYKKLILQYGIFWNWSKDELFKKMKIIRKDYRDFIEDSINNAYNNIMNRIIQQINSKTINTSDRLSATDLKSSFNILIQLRLITGKNKDEMKVEIQKIFTKYKTDSNYILEWKKLIENFDNNFQDNIEKYNKINELLKELDSNKKTGNFFNVLILNKNKKENFILNQAKLKRFFDAVKDYNIINNLFKKNVENSNFPEYFNFKEVILREFKKPIRESTNIDLQVLIEQNDNESIKYFYEIMKIIFLKYFYLKKTTINVKSFDEIKKFMNVGMCNINMGGLSEPRREIYVYVDFIKGELNDANVKQIYCPYLGEHLGKEFEYLSRLAFQGRTKFRDEWNINKHRTILSIKDLLNNEETEGIEREGEEGEEGEGEGEGEKKFSSNTIDNNQNLLLQKPLLSELNQKKPSYLLSDYNQLFQNKSQAPIQTTSQSQSPIQIPIELNRDFQYEIISKNKDQINKLINETNKYANPLEMVNNVELLNFINKNENRLFKIIEEWKNGNILQNIELREKMIRLFNEIQTEIELDEGILKYAEISKNVVETNKLNYKKNLLSLYKEILKYLKESENRKILKTQSSSLLRTGGLSKKKQKNKKKGFTKKIYKRKVLKG